MSADEALIARVTTLTLPLGPVTARRMFSGYGLYLDGAMFAIVARGALYLKAGAEDADRFRAAGSCPFTYRRQGRNVALSFWRLPGSAWAGIDAFLPWAEQALAAARRAKRSASKKRKRRT